MIRAGGTALVALVVGAGLTLGGSTPFVTPASALVSPTSAAQPLTTEPLVNPFFAKTAPLAQNLSNHQTLVTQSHSAQPLATQSLVTQPLANPLLSPKTAKTSIFATAFKTDDDDIIVNPEDVYVNPDDIVINPDDVVVNTDDLTLPTWKDVEAAKKNKNDAAAKVTEIEGLLAQVAIKLEGARQRSEAAAMRADAAQEDFRKAHLKAEDLQLQAAESAEEANTAAEHAAGLISQMYRSGGIDRNLELFLETDADTADVLLDRLAMMQKATERNVSVAEEAEFAMNNALTLGEQAEAASQERERLYDIAMREAEAAAAEVASAREELVATEAQQTLLQTQLAALKDEEVETTAGYQERLEETERRRQVEEQRLFDEAYASAEAAAIEAEKEKIRKERAAAEAARIAAEEEAARKKAEKEAAKQQNSSSSSGGGKGGGSSSSGSSSGGSSSGTSSPPVSSSGWVSPLAGGYRITTEWWGYWGHEGMDLAIGAWTPIYAAQSGQVSISGWWGGCGNMVHLEHTDGTSTRYCHMVESPAVYAGQWVGAGQILGYVGTTGNSTGNHLHYETWINGIPVDPRPFMDARGIWL